MTFNLIAALNKTHLVRNQADYLLLYEQNWLKEGTEVLVLKKTAALSKEKPMPNWQIWLAHSYSAILHKMIAYWNSTTRYAFKLTLLASGLNSLAAYCFKKSDFYYLGTAL